MWAKTFDQRLQDWYSLRQSIQTLPLETSLIAINSWWHNSPWQPYYLHWDELESWPDPWGLLDINVFDSVARGLGMLYTVMLVDSIDLEFKLILTTEGHTLLVDQNQRYILNWDPSSIVNTELDFKVQRWISSDYFCKKYC